ncbi:MAG: hypothetical protein Q8O91_06615 [Candidatus Aminicenantes bacterium]|nr:hypothetical protein [Candidatus Aminicenantes bacterium]
MKSSWTSIIVSLVTLASASAAAQDPKRAGEGFFITVSDQSLAFKGDFDSRLVLWHFDKAFFVPELKHATAFGFSLGIKRSSWLWELIYVNSRHPSASEDREGSSFYRSVEIDGRSFLVKDFPLKPYILVGISVPWLTVDQGAEMYGVKYRATYIGLGLNFGGGIIMDIAPFLFVSGGVVYRALGYFYVSGEGKGRDINDLRVGQDGPAWKSWLKTSSLGLSFGLGLVF